MQIRNYVESDYLDIQSWALANEQCPPPQYVLPIGGIVEKDGVKIACGFLYLDSQTCVAVIEWIFFNPTATARQKHQALNLIIDCLEHVAKEQGHPYLMAGSNYSGIVKQFLKRNWHIGAMGMAHLIKIKGD